MSRVVISQAAPPQVHNIVAHGPVTAPSYKAVRVVTMEETQFWKEWIDRFLDSPIPPREYVEKLTRWRESLAPTQLVIESDIDTYCLAMWVFLDFEEYSIEHGEEDDVHYRLTMWEHTPHEMQLLDHQHQPLPPPLVDARPPNAEVYTVVSGDSLTKIARRFNQPDSAWRELYDLNREVIHARGNRDLIFPGQRFKVPDSWLA